MDLNLAQLAERVRSACIGAATHAYEDAGVQGLCAEGRFEAAIDAIRRLDLARAVQPPAIDRTIDRRMKRSDRDGAP